MRGCFTHAGIYDERGKGAKRGGGMGEEGKNRRRDPR